MKPIFSIRFFLGICLFGLATASCIAGDPVRHLSSDICLITPNLTQQEVLASLGPPDKKEQGEAGEVWTYHEVQTSTMRKAPLLGKHLGSENYDVVTITFAGDRVRTCVYRTYDEEEFKKSGIKLREPLKKQ